MEKGMELGHLCNSLATLDRGVHSFKKLKTSFAIVEGLYTVYLR